MVETFQRTGTNTNMGTDLTQAFQDAGLPAPSTQTDTLFGSEQWMPDVLQSLRPQMRQLNLATEPLGDFDTLSQRLEAEVVAASTPTPLPGIVSAWSRKPKN